MKEFVGRIVDGFAIGIGFVLAVAAMRALFGLGIGIGL